jgi:type 1 glutamine amidotransferase
MKQIPVLLLTGANNHDWKRSAPLLKRVLEGTGRFAVTLTEQPSAVLEDAAGLKAYRLFLLDYNGPDWSPAAQRNFLAAVAGGTGVVAVHAANNSFPEWKEYEKMIGLTWRPESGHGEFHDFTVEIDDATHPITRGVAAFQTPDELYHRLVRTPGVDLKVLASAWSEPKRGGTGQREPMLTVTHYGQGRVFYHALGHVWAGDPAANRGCSMVALESPGFQDTLIRGCEWAATGEVTAAAKSSKI